MSGDEHLDLLYQAGYAVVPLSPRLLRIDNGERSMIARVVALQQPPSPTVIQREAERARNSGADVPVFLLTRTNKTVRSAAMQKQLAVVGAADRIVIVNGDVVDLSEETARTHPSMRRRPWGRLAVAREIIRHGGVLSSQVATSKAIGLSQPAVGKAYSILRSEGLLPDDSARELTHSQLGALIDYSIEQYPGPGGIGTYWYSSAGATLPPDLNRAVHDASGLLSGDLAADSFAPWKQPRTATIYTPTGLDLAAYGLAESNSSTANVILRVPEDATMWRTAQEWTDQKPARFTDPLITAWELSQSSDVDADQAVDRIKQRLLDESGPR